MFRALAEVTGSPTASSVTSDNFPLVQSHLYTKALPKMVPVGSPQKQDFLLSRGFDSMKTIDPMSRQVISDLKGGNYPMSLEVPQAILDKNAQCGSASIDSLIGSTNLNDSIRCGWIYKKGPNGRPEVSKGALGTRDGPVQLIDQPEGKWYWNLDKAKVDVDTDFCNTITMKGDLAIGDNGKRCEWDTVKNIAVRMGTATKPPQERSRDICTPLPNGKLSRDCLLQRVSAAGCLQGGALAQALQTGATPADYAAGLRGLPSFIAYQQKSSTPLLDTVLRDGSATTQTALQTFTQVANATAGKTSLNAAARDLCLKKGDYDKFDFCSEYTDTTPGPFALNCLQKAWKSMGGLASGSLYPTAASKASYWDRKSNWGAVIREIGDLAAKSSSDNLAIQRNALKAFMGIQRSQLSAKQIEALPGAEVFWFNISTSSFIGRRVHTRVDSQGNLIPQFSTGDQVEKTGLSDNISFTAITNIRPEKDMTIRMTFETDDGTAIFINTPADMSAIMGRGVVDTKNSMGRWFPQGTTRHTNKECWSLVGSGPNYMTASWFEFGGWAHFKMFMSPCNSQTLSEIPANWFTLTQEPDAPMLSFEVNKNKNGALKWREFRLASVFGSGIAGSAAVKAATSNNSVGAGIVVLGPRGGIVFDTKMGMNSWRTITIGFRMEGNPDASVGLKLFTMGPLSIMIDGSQKVALQCAGISGRRVLSGSLIAGQSYSLVINVRSDYQGQMPNRIVVSCASITNWINGNVSMGDISISANASTDGGRSLFNKSDGFAPMIGDVVGKSPAVSILWTHFFDQELTTEMVVRDARGNWARKFIEE